MPQSRELWHLRETLTMWSASVRPSVGAQCVHLHMGVSAARLICFGCLGERIGGAFVHWRRTDSAYRCCCSRWHGSHHIDMGGGTGRNQKGRCRSMIAFPVMVLPGNCSRLLCRHEGELLYTIGMGRSFCLLVRMRSTGEVNDAVPVRGWKEGKDASNMKLRKHQT